MALKDFLLAFKALITENEVLPRSATERANYYQTKFPKLSTLEIQDLAKIEPQKFRIYTGTIFRGEAVILQRRFPVTFAALKKHWQEISKDKTAFDAFTFVLQIQKFYPWQSYHTNDFADNFLKYLESLISETSESSTFWILDMSKFEAAIAKLRRSPIEHPASEISALEISRLSVQQCLSLKLQLRRDVAVVSSNFDLLEIRKFYMEHEETLPEPIKAEGRRTFVVSRSTKLYPKVSRLEPEENLYLAELNDQQLGTIETFALKTLMEEAAKTLSAEQIFAQKLERILQLERVGILRILA